MNWPAVSTTGSAWTLPHAGCSTTVCQVALAAMDATWRVQTDASEASGRAPISSRMLTTPTSR